MADNIQVQVPYYYITDAEKTQLEALWPQLAEDFSLSCSWAYNSGDDIRWYATIDSINDIEAAFLTEYGWLRTQDFNFSNQPGYFGG